MELVFPGNNLEKGPKTLVLEMAPVDIGTYFFGNGISRSPGWMFVYFKFSAHNKGRTFAVCHRKSQRHSPSRDWKVWPFERINDILWDLQPMGVHPFTSILLHQYQDNTEIHAGDPCFARVVAGLTRCVG